MKPTSEEVKKAVTLFVKNGGAVETIPPEKVPTQDQVGLFTGPPPFGNLQTQHINHLDTDEALN